MYKYKSYTNPVYLHTHTHTHHVTCNIESLGRRTIVDVAVRDESISLTWCYGPVARPMGYQDEKMCVLHVCVYADVENRRNRYIATEKDMELRRGRKYCYCYYITWYYLLRRSRTRGATRMRYYGPVTYHAERSIRSVHLTQWTHSEFVYAQRTLCGLGIQYVLSVYSELVILSILSSTWYVMFTVCVYTCEIGRTGSAMQSTHDRNDNVRARYD